MVLPLPITLPSLSPLETLLCEVTPTVIFGQIQWTEWTLMKVNSHETMSKGIPDLDESRKRCASKEAGFFPSITIKGFEAEVCLNTELKVNLFFSCVSAFFMVFYSCA